MLLDYQLGQGSIVLRVKLKDSVTGLGKTALTIASAGLIISTIADNESAPTVYTQAGGTIETITTLGTYAAPTATKCRFKLVDDTNHPGIYEIQIANARFGVNNAKSVLVSWSGVWGLADGDALIPLRSVNPYDGVRFGVTALPAAAANAAGGLIISPAGGLDPDEMNADIEAIETRVALALPNAAPQAAGGLVTSLAGALDLDELNADVESIETRVILALPNAAPQAAGGLIISPAGGLDPDEMNADIEAAEAQALAIFNRIGAPINASISADLQAALTTALTESYAADGSPASASQLLYMIWSYLNDFVIAGTAMTSRKLDGATTSMVHTLNDPTNPTGVTRAS